MDSQNGHWTGDCQLHTACIYDQKIEHNGLDVNNKTLGKLLKKLQTLKYTKIPDNPCIAILSLVIKCWHLVALTYFSKDETPECQRDFLNEESDEENMAEFDSLSFALLIPFAICFVLVFIVCCFADEIKDICRMPSPLPSSYLAVERARPNRSNSRRQGRQGRPQSEEVRNLILSEEGRSRNVSESSTDFNAVNNLLTNSSFNIVRQPGASLHQNVMMLPQTTLPTGSQTILQTGSQRFGIPNTSCIVSRPEVHGSVAQLGTQRIIIQPLSQFATQSTSRNNSKNFSRNLTIHASTSSKDIGSCLKQNSVSCDSESNTNNSQRADLNRNGSAPELLNKYLSNGSTNTPNASSSTKQETSNSQSGQLR